MSPPAVFTLMAVKVPSFLWVALGLWFGGAMPLLLAQSLPGPGSEVVIVLGAADDALPNKAEAAQYNAYKSALLQVAPVFVESRASSSMNQLVSNYTYTEVRGFVQEAVPLGVGYSREGIYYQQYRITINTQDFNQELVKKKIDVKILYDQVARPKICLAVEDYFKNSPEDREWQRDPTHFSNGIIMQYFQKKHPGFVFKDLFMLRNSSQELPDLIAEANKNSFDILVYGTTRSIPKKLFTLPGRPIDFGTTIQAKQAGSDLMRHECEITWNVIKVSTKETLFPVMIFPGGELLADSVLANIPTKYKPVETGAATLFRELLSHWNQVAFSQSIEVTFQSYETLDALALTARLRQVQGLNPQSIRLESSQGGRIVFQVNAAGILPEILSGLGKVFKDEFAVADANNSAIKLLAVAGAVAEVKVNISRISLSDLRVIETKLREFPGIENLKRGTFSAGTAELTVKTFKSSEDIGVYIEQQFPSLVVENIAESSIHLVGRR